MSKTNVLFSQANLLVVNKRAIFFILLAFSGL